MKTKMTSKEFRKLAKELNHFTDLDMSNCNLDSLRLNYCQFINCDMDNVNFQRADINGSVFTNCSMNNIDFYKARIQYNQFLRSDLRGACLFASDLSYSTVFNTNLDETCLKHANLFMTKFKSVSCSKIQLPAPTIVLLADWGIVSDELTTELMRYDAENHPNPERFDKWARWAREKGDKSCPYENCFVERSANFTQKEHCWSPGPAKSALELMEMILDEKFTGWKG